MEIENKGGVTPISRIHETTSEFPEKNRRKPESDSKKKNKNKDSKPTSQDGLGENVDIYI